MDTTQGIESSNVNTEAKIEDYLAQHQSKELLRFVAVGSVDDGKSTLIGRLLHDTKGVYEDQLSAVKKASAGDTEIDFSLFTDGLKAEREQGITIDVAYRYFSTDKRKFIIADTPGHVQYTRNMATGASTANVAVILIDARLGVLQQSRRHAHIASLLGIPNLLVAVNKLDLKAYSEKVYRDIVADFRSFGDKLSFTDIKFVPISAKLGDNVVHDSKNTPWYTDGTLLSYLESVPISLDSNADGFRFPVQYVLRPDLNYRGFSGEVVGGVVKQGDPVMVLPSRKTSRVASLDTFDGELKSAGPRQPVTIRLEDEIDISRGDVLVHTDNLPQVGRRFQADVVWMSETPLDTDKSYLLKTGTQMVRTNVDGIVSVMNLQTLVSEPADQLSLNDIACLRLTAHREVVFDAYSNNRATGAFILIDSLTNNTVGAGMIRPQAERAPQAPVDSDRGRSQVSTIERRQRLAQLNAMLRVGNAAGESFAYALERSLFDRQYLASVVSQTSEADRPEHQVAAANALSQAGVLAITVGLSDGPATTADLVVEIDKDDNGAITVDGQPLDSKRKHNDALANVVCDALATKGILLPAGEK